MKMKISKGGTDTKEKNNMFLCENEKNKNGGQTKMKKQNISSLYVGISHSSVRSDRFVRFTRQFKMIFDVLYNLSFLSFLKIILNVQKKKRQEMES
jgi:hypothetical protein